MGCSNKHAGKAAARTAPTFQFAEQVGHVGCVGGSLGASVVNWTDVRLSWLILYVTWRGHRDSNRRRLRQFACVGQVVRAPEFEPSWGVILCVGTLVRTL